MADQMKYKRIAISDTLGAYVALFVSNMKHEPFEKFSERFECALRQVWRILPLGHRRAILRQLRKYPMFTFGVTETGRRLSSKVYLRVDVGYVKMRNADAHVNRFGDIHFRQKVFAGTDEFLTYIILHEMLHLVWWGYDWMESGKRANRRNSDEHIWIENECKRLGYDEITIMLNYYTNKRD